MNFPDDLFYTKTHEWVKLDNGCFLVGISEYAQNELSDVVYVELPEVGREIKAGETICVVESVKAAFDIYSPVSGVIEEANAALEDDPSLVNSDPYESGWFIRVKSDDTEQVNQLMPPTEYKKHVLGA